jgi:hypothetical protein
MGGCDLARHHKLNAGIHVGRNFGPLKPGFSKTSTRRSASLAVISPPASTMAERMLENRQEAGQQGSRGSGVTRSESESHSGARFCSLILASPTLRRVGRWLNNGLGVHQIPPESDIIFGA